jgi:hypothetical protein
MSHHVVWLMSIDVSEERTASVFKLEDYSVRHGFTQSLQPNVGIEPYIWPGPLLSTSFSMYYPLSSSRSTL